MQGLDADDRRLAHAGRGSAMSRKRAADITTPLVRYPWIVASRPLGLSPSMTGLSLINGNEPDSLPAARAASRDSSVG